MKSPEIENVVVDEANEVTYIITAGHRLTDGELYSTIRVALFARGKRLSRGETLRITTSKWDR